MVRTGKFLESTKLLPNCQILCKKVGIRTWSANEDVSQNLIPFSRHVFELTTLMNYSLLTNLVCSLAPTKLRVGI
jgi:hypothetical protein